MLHLYSIPFKRDCNDINILICVTVYRALHVCVLHTQNVRIKFYSHIGEYRHTHIFYSHNAHDINVTLDFPFLFINDTHGSLFKIMRAFYKLNLD